jgi:hypothetical protein
MAQRVGAGVIFRCCCTRAWLTSWCEKRRVFWFVDATYVAFTDEETERLSEPCGASC